VVNRKASRHNLGFIDHLADLIGCGRSINYSNSPSEEVAYACYSEDGGLECVCEKAMLEGGE
jgi:hypothetical protein